ncbi:melanoma inhibitory activity protein 2 [Rhynchocyon petersi]
MADLGIHSLLLLVLSLAKSLESTKLLAELKKCGDLECQTLMNRVIAIRDYRGPDCRYLNFTKGEEISVYIKLAGEREDLWAGSKEKDFGYFPRDAVQIEEVFLSEEVQIPTKESDFFCLLEGNYKFENEDIELSGDNNDILYPHEEEEDQLPTLFESDFLLGSGFSSAFESTSLEDQFLIVDNLDDTRRTHESKKWEEVEAKSVEWDALKEAAQDQIPELDHVSPSSALHKVTEHFALTTKPADRQAFESVTKPVQESSLQSREIAGVNEEDLEERKDDDPQIKHSQESDLEFDLVPNKESEIVSESKHVLKPQVTGWFDGGFTRYFGFEDEDTAIELLSKESNQPCHDVPDTVSSDEELTVPGDEIVEKGDPITDNSSVLKSSWFDFGLGMLGFSYAVENATVSDDRKNEGGSGDNNEHPVATEFGSAKEQEAEMENTMETKDQVDKESTLEKTDDSDTLPYFKKFLYNFDNSWNFQNIPKDKEMSFPKQIVDKGNIIENEETEEFSVDNHPTDNMMFKSSYHYSDLPMRIQEEESQIQSSKNNDEEAKTLLVTEGQAQIKVSGFVENNQLHSQMFPSDNSRSSQHLIPWEEHALDFQTLKYFFQIYVYEFINAAFSLIKILKEMQRGFRRTVGVRSRSSHSPSRLRGGLFQSPGSGLGSGCQAVCCLLFVVAGPGRGCSCDSQSRLGAMEGPRAALQPYLGLVLEKLRMVGAALPEDMRPGTNFLGFPWELVIGATVFGIFVAVLFLWRIFQMIRSYRYVGREKKLAVKLAALIEEKCELLEKFSLVQKEYEGLELSMKDISFGNESTKLQSLEVISENLDKAKSETEDEILVLEKECEEEKSKGAEQVELMADISKQIKSLEEESNSLKSKLAEAKMTLKVYEMNEERLKITIKDTMNDNSQLRESQKELLQEVEEWKEKLSELNKQKLVCEDTKVHAEQVLKDKENQIKSLMECLLKDWPAVLGQDLMDDENLDLELNIDSEDGTHLDDQPREPLKKLIHAAKLNVSLKTLEGKRNELYTQLSETDKRNEELTECIKDLQMKHSSLESENTLFDNENQKLQQKLKVMTELYQENEMKLHRKLTVEENSRLEKEDKLLRADEKLIYATEELENYRKRVKDLEEECEKTNLSYQGQITSHEKKAHDNWLAARNAERILSDLKKENAYNRQKLTEAELKYELLEKDSYALDVPNTTFGREHSPYGPSPLGRPSSETRAFLSPPTLLEGPLRLSPLLPGGGGRGSIGPGNPVDHQTPERGDSSYDRLLDPHRALSDTGSLSPPWEQDRRMMNPFSGQPYPDSALPPQRQDRFYSNSGRLSGPAELRSFNMPSFDKADGSSEMDSSKNDPKDDLGNLNVPDSSLPAQSGAGGPSFVPPPVPPIRSPLFPVDPRGPFMRRGAPFPPPPPGSMYGPPRNYFPPRNFTGPPPPPLAMRNIYPPRGFPHYLPPRPGFYPPPPHPENRSEFPSGAVQPPSYKPASEHPEPQQEV